MNQVLSPLSPAQKQEGAQQFVRSVVFDLILTLCLCGLWNIWVQARQMRALNFILRTERYSFWPWLIFTLLTCGLYHFYHEYKMSKDLCVALNRPHSDRPLLHIVLCCLGLSIVVDAIQQSEINDFFGSHQL